MIKIDFDKNSNGLVPVIVQDFSTKNVLMLGYMNKEAYNTTITSQKVTFYSRSKKRLWTKGEESGNFLQLVTIKVDCDNDTLLVLVVPKGPTCHKETATCWGEDNEQSFGFLTELEKVIKQRKDSNSKESYISSLFTKGINKIAQKVGEEAVEVVIEAKDSNDDLFLNEAADLLFHYLILLQARGYELNNVVNILKART